VLHLAGTDDPPSGPTSPRVGFVVSRAVGNAVVRNRVRRRLRHLVRDRLGELPPGAVVVVRALPDAAGASSDELRGDVARCLERVLPRVQPQPAAHDAGAMVPR
jgi:ribonuclease P protein component